MPLPALAVLLSFWLAGSMLLGLDLGRNSDDCSLNLRDAATGQLPPGVNPLAPYPYFFRPIHLALTFGLGTYAPGADRLMHALSAISHGAACVLLAMFARRACRGGPHSPWLAPVLCTLVFMTWPTQSEVILWYSTISTSLSVCVFIGLAWLICEYVARGPRLSSFGGPIAIFAAAFFIACLYEQPLAGSTGLPILALGMRRCPGALDDPKEPSRFGASLGRALIAMSMCLLAGALYAALLLGTSPVGTRGGSGSFVPAHMLLDRARELWESIAYVVWGKHAHDTLLGSFHVGLDTLAGSRGVMLLALLAAAITTGCAWVVTRRTVPSPRFTDDSGSPMNLDPLWTALGSLIALLAGLAPVFVVSGQPVQDRNLYFPFAMFVLMSAPLVDIGLRRLKSLSVRGAPLALVVVCCGIATFGVISQVGWQRVFRDRSRRDRQILAEVVELMPRPPIGAVFVPLRADNPVAQTGYRRFDALPMSLLDTHWSFTDELRRAYKRNDIACAGWARWTPPTLCSLTPQGASISDAAARTWTRTDPARRLTWSTIVPLVITPAGNVQLVRELEVEQADGRVSQIPVLSVHRAVRHRHVPPSNLTTHRTWDECPTFSAAPRWTWARTGTPAAFPRSYVWFGQRESTQLHPFIEGGARSELHTTLDASDTHRRVCVYVTIADFDLDKGDESAEASVTLAATSVIEGTPRQLASTTALVRAGDIRTIQGWQPLVLDLPPTAQPATLSLSIAQPTKPQPGQPTATPIVHVTPGTIVDRAALDSPVTPATRQ